MRLLGTVVLVDELVHFQSQASALERREDEDLRDFGSETLSRLVGVEDCIDACDVASLLMVS